MNLNQLLTFYHAADSMNFSRAASRLNVTQPAVSAQIRQLESDLGVKLFVRLGKKLMLSEPGEVLLQYARKIFSLRDEAEEVLENLRSVRKGTLKLGTARTYARNVMPVLLARFQKHFPKVNIVLMEGSSLEMARSLWSLDVEVAVVAYPGPVKRVKFNFLNQEDLVVIASPQHRLAGVEGISVKRLAKEPVIMREKGSGTRRAAGDLFRRYRVKPEIVLETSNSEVIQEQVARGIGISVLTRSAVHSAVTSHRLAVLNLDIPTPKLDICTAVLEGHELSGPAQAFLDLLYSGTTKTDRKIAQEPKLG